MNLMKHRYFGVAGVVAGVIVMAALTVVAVGAQQGPPPGRGPGGQGGPGGPGGHGFGMMGPGGPGGMGRGMMGMGLRELNLTEDQKAQIKTIMDANKDAIQAIGKQLHEARMALGDAATADQTSEQAIRDAASAIGKLEGDAAILRSQIHAKVFAVLTPDQQTKAKQLRADAKAHAGEGRGPMGRGRGRGPGRGGIGGWI